MKLHLIREQSILDDDFDQPARPSAKLRTIRILWTLAGIGLLVFGGDVLVLLHAARHSVIGASAAVVIWLQAFDCFVRAYRCIR